MTNKVLVFSHACVLPANQSVYVELAASHDLVLVVPRRWTTALRRETFAAHVAPNFRGQFRPVPVLLAGRAQRHIPLLRIGKLLRDERVDVAVIEEESFSLAAYLWARACVRARVPYAVQAAENLDRPLPRVVRLLRRYVLSHAGLIMARSPAAGERAREWGAIGVVTVIAHGVDAIDERDPEPRTGVVGLVGRLVPEKGVADVIDVIRTTPELRLEVVGDGPMRELVNTAGERVRWLGSLDPEAVTAFYRSIAVLAVPSRTTATWSEQFGRVIVEAQAVGTPVVAYDSGEIPWVAEMTAAHLVPEGDVDALARTLQEVALTDEGWLSGTLGRKKVALHFTNHHAAEQLRAWIEAARA